MFPTFLRPSPYANTAVGLSPAGIAKRLSSSISAGLLSGALLFSATTAHAQAMGTPGLTADYYRGYFYDSLSFFTTHSPQLVNKPVEQLNFPEAETDNFGVGNVATYYSPGKPDEFSGRFQGQLCVLTAGQYTFYLGSDDAAYLWLDGNAQPLAFNKGDLYGYREVAATCTLAAGLHTLRVYYGEHGGSQGLVLQYSGPSQPKQLVPNGVLYSQATATILPTLSELEVTANAQQQVAVKWSTAAEQNSTAFVVQRSTDGVIFQDLPPQASTGAAPGPHQYEYLDQQPAMGLSYYRVQHLRSDRSAVYSPIKSVEVKAMPFTVGVYPVPNDGNFYVQMLPTKTGVAQLELTDITGRLMYQQQVVRDGKPQYIQPGQAVGIYRLRLTTDDGRYYQKISLGY